MGQSNVQLLLGSFLEQRQRDSASELQKDDFFEVFCASETLKAYDLSLEEIQDGLVDGGGDGGIDCVYLFANGDPLEEDALGRRTPPDTSLEVHIFQCKNSESFQGTAMDRLIGTVSGIFDLSRPIEELATAYNESLVSRIKLFRTYYSKNISSISRLDVRIKYFSRSEHVHPALQEQAKTLNSTAERMFPTATISFEFVGAAELLKLAQAPPQRWIELTIKDGPLAVGSSGYVTLVSLHDYSSFMLDDSHNRRRSLFLENVREYEGAVGVNKAIAETLAKESPSEDFWMLNNGVTVIADAVRQGYKVLSLRDPKIVNGLQTSVEILRHRQAGALQRADLDGRSVLVRIVVPQDEASRDRIIVATNNQTPIPSGVLKSTDKIHRAIETYLVREGLYYERQRNAYRNEGREANSIITIPQLARCMTSVYLLHPEVAVRTNSQRLLTQGEHYDKIFSDRMPLPVYLNALRILMHVRSATNTLHLTGSDDDYIGRGRGGRLGNLQWHMCSFIAVAATRTNQITAKVLTELDPSTLTSIPVSAAADRVNRSLAALKERLGSKRTLYRLAKQPASTEAVIESALEWVRETHGTDGRLSGGVGH